MTDFRLVSYLDIEESDRDAICYGITQDYRTWGKESKAKERTSKVLATLDRQISLLDASAIVQPDLSSSGKALAYLCFRSINYGLTLSYR